MNINEFRVLLLDGTWTAWRRVGIDAWRLEEAYTRHYLGEYQSVEVRYAETEPLNLS